MSVFRTQNSLMSAFRISYFLPFLDNQAFSYDNPALSGNNPALFCDKRGLLETRKTTQKKSTKNMKKKCRKTCIIHLFLVTLQ